MQNIYGYWPRVRSRWLDIRQRAVVFVPSEPRAASEKVSSILPCLNRKIRDCPQASSILAKLLLFFLRWVYSNGKKGKKKRRTRPIPSPRLDRMSLVSKVFITYPRELSSCGTYAWGPLPSRETDQNTRFTLSCLFAADPAILNALVLYLKILYWTVKTPLDSLSDQERRSKQRPDRTNQSWKVL